MNNCLECNKYITFGVIDYSVNSYGIPLCIEHQQWINFMQTQTTCETIRLYFALKERGVPAKMEAFDGYKHVDIQIKDANVNIEVDGQHHNFDKEQALKDLKRTYHSFRDGILTLRIPNALVYNENILNETAGYIVAFLNENLKNKYQRNLG